MSGVIDEEYRRFIRGKPCLICGKQPVDFAHLVARGSGGKGQKSSDYTGVPLCREHHQMQGQIGISKIEKKYQAIRLNLWRDALYFVVEYFSDRASGSSAGQSKVRGVPW